MRLIIISGKIGSGKSTLSKCFEKKGYHYIDSDKLAKDLILNSKPIRDKLVNEFDILKKENIISLKKLKILFLSSKDNKNKINSIIHPFFYKKLNILVKSYKNKIVIELPLIETRNNIMSKFEIVTLETKLNIRKKRYLDKMPSKTEDFMILNRYQKSYTYYKNSSDYVISNNDTMELLKMRFNKLYSKFKNE